MKLRSTQRFRARRLSLQALESRIAMAADEMFCVPSAADRLPQDGESRPALIMPASDFGSTINDDPNSARLLASTSSRPEGEAVSASGHSPFDPSGDYLVTPLDALQVLIHLSNVQRGSATIDAAAIRKFDTSDDNNVTPLDALIVLNAISSYTRTHGGTLNIPQTSWLTEPTIIDNRFTAVDLSLRLNLADEVDNVFGMLHDSGGNPSIVDLSSLVSGGAIELSHSQVVSLFAPQPNSDLSFSFWTDLVDSSVHTHLEITWAPPATPDVLLIENAENGLTNLIDQTHSSYSLIQDSVVSEGSNAFHLAHPTAASNWFAINQTLSIRSDTKLYFMSRLNWATPTQIAKVQLSTDEGATWPITVFTQAGDATNLAGDGGFVFRQIDLSAYAGQNVRVRFFYEFSGGSRYPQTTTDIGWVIDDIRVGSSYETTAYSIGQPTNLEQWLLEYANRARANGIAEANRLAGDTTLANVYTQFGIDPANIVSQYTASIASGFISGVAQPLAFNPILLQAARLHSQDMIDNAFQGHSSSVSPPSPFQPGFSPSDRAESLGYNGGVAENVYAFASSVPFAHAGFAVDWGAETPGAAGYNPAFAGQGMQNPAGHRRNLHNNNYNEAGFAVVLGSNGSIGPQVVTQKLGSSGVPLITGVAYIDQDNNDFYSPGEGRGGIRVEVQGAAFHAITSASGGYAVPVSGDGTYLVTFSGEGIETWSTQVVVTNEANAKLDYILTA